MPKATANIATISPFNNRSAGDLADELGNVKAQIADLETREKALRDELIRRGESTIDGSAYTASITNAVRWTLDTKAVKSEMGLPWFDARCRQSLVTTVAVKALAEAVPAKLAA
jgi:hypothetical protein